MAKRSARTSSGLFYAALVLLASVVLTRSEDIETCIKASKPGVCVYKYRCKDGYIIEFGEGLIDIRSSDVCGNPLMECCQEPEEPNENTTVDPSTNDTSTDRGTSTTVAPPGPIVPPYQQQQCGQRNPNGVIFKIENNVFSESEYGEFPWVVAIFRLTGEPKPQFLCSGTLIDVAAVLTTASCFQRYRGAGNKFMVRMGEWDLSNDREPIPTVEREVETLHIHPRYSVRDKVNDIAVIILSDSVQLTHTIGLACLPDASLRFNDIVGVGWGDAPSFLQPQKLPQTILKKSQLTVIGAQQCQRTMRKLITPRYTLSDSFICAEGHAPEMLPCKGDSGSPYMVSIPTEQERYFVVGLSSWGFDCNVQDAPTVLTNVGYHREWIDQIISTEGLSPFSYTYHQQEEDDDD
ncbi:CLIP-domain serine protease subfamily A [Anopheles darlingi]|uniref:CLIP-domain serine protease subfamily A n=1 Tax=Anopheles darlingi TaxID=43151 RepID=W5JAQ5_ANODA|nr:CLIP-domain serine protease subfamily A [Anopheles darlingi]